MDLFACDECRAIYRELRQASRPLPFALALAPQQIGDWLRQIDDELAAQMRETSLLWKTWRRLQEHRALTGHSLSVSPFRPNPN
jgi:hypothetical protein